MSGTTAPEDAALARALDLARRGPATGPNPRVGCVLLDAAGSTLAEGWHRGAGTPHAEVDALATVPADRHHALRGATAVVTLEPCNHTGRTGPCSAALADAGIQRVVYGVADPSPAARGGASWLAQHGVQAVQAQGAGAEAAADLLEPWLVAVGRGRPWVVAKTACSLDGRVAAADGTSRWITSPASRAHAHRVRAEVDAIMVGTGTVLADDPELTARDRDGALVEHQPLRVVVGHRDVPPGARLAGPGGTLVQLRTHDLGDALATLGRREIRTVLLEGGPTVLSAALTAGLVDELHAYVAPLLLGSGRPAVDDLGVATLGAARRWSTRSLEQLDQDVHLVLRPHPAPTGGL